MSKPPQATHFVIDSFLSETSEAPTDTDTWDTIFVDLPSYFVNSTHSHKSVEIELVRVIDFESWKDGVEVISSMHSDLADQDASSDCYVCASNTLYNNPKSYLVGANRNKMECWFRRIDGSIINLHPAKTRIIIEMLLRY